MNPQPIPPFAIGDHVRCTYRKDPANQSRGVVTKLRYIGGPYGWAVWARGLTKSGKPTIRSYFHHTLVLDATSAPPPVKP